MVVNISSVIYRAFSFVHNERSPAQGEREKFNWSEALLDALIIAGLNFFSCLSALSVLQILENPLQALVAAIISAGFGFFSTLAIKRGLRRE